MMLHRLQGRHYVAGEPWTASAYRSQYDLFGILAPYRHYPSTPTTRGRVRETKVPSTYSTAIVTSAEKHPHGFLTPGLRAVKDCGCGPFFRTRGDASSVLADILYCNDAGWALQTGSD